MSEARHTERQPRLLQSRASVLAMTVLLAAGCGGTARKHSSDSGSSGTAAAAGSVVAQAGEDSAAGTTSERGGGSSAGASAGAEDTPEGGNSSGGAAGGGWRVGGAGNDSAGSAGMTTAGSGGSGVVGGSTSGSGGGTSSGNMGGMLPSGGAAPTAGSGGAAGTGGRGAQGGTSGELAGGVGGTSAGAGGSQVQGGTGGSSGSGGVGGSGGSGGSVDGCAETTEPGTPDSGAAGASGSAAIEAGQQCSQLLQLRCSGPNQKLSMFCGPDSVWQLYQECGIAQNCDQWSGVCGDIVPGCLGQYPGFTFCDGDEVHTCGPDLIRVTSTSCCGLCTAGACVASICGDRMVASGEECDDGNDTVADGCEPDCVRSEVLAITAGESHSCALLRGGLVRCWGGNNFGQLGLGNVESQSDRHPYELGPVALGAPAVQIAAGRAHTCAVMASGAVQCWGDNARGQLGLGHTSVIGDDELPSAAVTTVALDRPALEVSAGGEVTCALLSDHSMHCWGANDVGQLGLGIPDAQVAEPSMVSVGEDVRAAATSGLHTCAVIESNRILCWGEELSLGTDQAIGDNEPPTDGSYVAFGVDEPYYDVITGGMRTCALASGRPSHNCWGYNGDGGLGLGNPEQFSWALYYWDQHPPQFIVAGLQHICVGLWSHQLHCFGWNDTAQLGLGDTSPAQASINLPAVDLGLDPDTGNPAYAVSAAAGALHTCVVLANGEVRCWGLNDQGQLGLGYVSVSPAYVGGIATELPGDLASVQMFPPL